MMVVIAIFAFFVGAYSREHTTKPPLVGPFNANSQSEQSTLLVYIVGEVNKPGVYNFPFNARVQDAIQKAGGPKAGADLAKLNLAAWLEDGSKIEVLPRQKIAALPSSPVESQAPQMESTLPSLPEYSALPDKPLPTSPDLQPQTAELRPTKTPVKSKSVKKPKPLGALPNVPREMTKSGDESQNADPKYLEKNQININTATADQLELLPGVGPAMAQKILEARKAKGGFKSIEELDEIRGMGEKTMEKLRPLVTVQ